MKYKKLKQENRHTDRWIGIKEAKVRAIKKYEKEKAKRMLVPIEFYNKIKQTVESTGQSAMSILRELLDRL